MPPPRAPAAGGATGETVACEVRVAPVPAGQTFLRRGFTSAGLGTVVPAARLGVSREHASELPNGRAPVSAATASGLAAVLPVGVGEIPASLAPEPRAGARAGPLDPRVPAEPTELAEPTEPADEREAARSPVPFDAGAPIALAPAMLRDRARRR